jgi:hypothetical protein
MGHSDHFGPPELSHRAACFTSVSALWVLPIIHSRALSCSYRVAPTPRPDTVSQRLPRTLWPAPLASLYRARRCRCVPGSCCQNLPLRCYDCAEISGVRIVRAVWLCWPDFLLVAYKNDSYPWNYPSTFIFYPSHVCKTRRIRRRAPSLRRSRPGELTSVSPVSYPFHRLLVVHGRGKPLVPRQGPDDRGIRRSRTSPPLNLTSPWTDLFAATITGETPPPCSPSHQFGFPHVLNRT